MPHIFPRRFLRTRDILETHEMNEDVRPVQELLDGNLDRHNFDGDDLKVLLKPKQTGGNPSVAEGAYYNVYMSNIESRYRFHRGPKGNVRQPPNFVKLDGATLRDSFTPFTATDSSLTTGAKPYVVPNTGEWYAVANADLSGTQKLTFTTGQSKVWLCAYAQYLWQGFYEYKPPFIYESVSIGGGFAVPPLTKSWRDVDFHNRKLRDIANFYGPQKEWKALPSLDRKNKLTNVVTYTTDMEYAFPLNEISAENEAINPNLGGYHHISQGFYPALVQFAFRVDGKIIDESITGKQYSSEESVHGLQVAESPLMGGGVTFRVGQRAPKSKISFSDTSGARAGQRLAGSRAVSCGPEVMPVRLGALVDLDPGEHTVELVVRRLSRKRVKFQAGDFVGVFSRRLVAFDLPQVPPRNEDKKSSVVVPNFKVEDVVKEVNFTDSRKSLAARENAIQPSDVFRGSLPNTHLPGKVVYSKSVTITPTFSVEAGSGFFESDAHSARPASRFPGFENTAILDREVASPLDGWNGTFSAADGAGWYMMQDNLAGKKLQIVSSGTDLTLLPGQKLLLFADIELRGFQHMLSPEGRQAVDFVGSGYVGVGEHAAWVTPERYLDIFALFSIGYKVGSDWTIASESVPALVNDFNWVNRGFGFCANFERTQSVDPSDYTGDMIPGNIAPGEPIQANDLRGGHTLKNNLGINVPIFQVIEATDATGTISISELAAFTCTEVPSYWTDGPGFGSADFETKYFWARPQPRGRKILNGVKVHFGNSRLSAIKLHK